MATAEPLLAAERLLTAEEFSSLPDNGVPMELVHGRIVAMNVPAPRHGYFCGRITRIVGNFAEDRDVGRVLCNDSGIVTRRGPDTVRGADVCYYSYERLPRGPIPAGYLSVVPEVVFEVRSPTDRWADVLIKLAEYLTAGVSAVCVHDMQTETLMVYRPEDPPRLLHAEEELDLPEIQADFRVPVRRFFE